MKDFTEEEVQHLKLFYPYAFRRRAEMMHSRQRFVHYTTADAAMSIIRNKVVWMRKSSVMNDFSEVEHGMKCLSSAYNDQGGDRFRGVFESIHPGITKELEERFNAWRPSLTWNTYITSMSEHDDDEDLLGRLSMWRAYSGSTGVAIVLNPQVFFGASDALSAYTSPVAYLSPSQFKVEFEALTSGLVRSVDMLKASSREETMGHIFEILRNAVLCTKHPGFREEREWRIIHTPQLQHSTRILRDIVSIGGVPQTICKIPLEDIPDEDLVGAAIPSLINRLIIGPTHHGMAMWEAFVELLSQAGVERSAEKVWVSEIPLRTP